MQVIEYLQSFNYVTVFIRILLACLAGGILGAERGKHGRVAGMRTHILVCTGAALTILIGIFIVDTLGIGQDATRIAAQTISGIGFLGAGMIIVKNDKMITGLTTAAIMWTTAIIGISVGIGFYTGALLAMLACLFTAAFLTRIERKRRKTARIYIEVKELPLLGEITDKIRVLLPEDSHIEIVPAKSNTAGHLGIYIITTYLKDVEAFKSDASKFEGVHFIISE